MPTASVTRAIRTPNGDTDSDGVDNLSDNCPLMANPLQEDTDLRRYW
jgi:hypothetical protein